MKLTCKDTNGQFTIIEGEKELTAGNITTIIKAGDLALTPEVCHISGE